MVQTSATRRKKARQKLTQEAIAFAEALAKKAFSPLPSHITQEVFDAVWLDVVAKIEQKTKESMDAKEAGYHQALKTAITFIEENQWQVKACYHFVRTPREKALRNAHWTKQAFDIYDVYAQWENDLQRKGFANDVTRAFADFLLSAIFHSGVCDANRLLGLVDTLLTKPIVSTFNGVPYLCYTVPDSRAKYTNQTDETGKKCHTGLCFIAPPTLALLNQFLKYRKKDWTCQNTLESLFEILAARCGYNFYRGKLKSAIFVTENITALTQPEVNFLIGQISTFSLSEKQFVTDELNSPKPQSLNAFASLWQNTSVLAAPHLFTGDLHKRLSTILSTAKRQPSANGKKNREKTIGAFNALIHEGVSDSESLLIEWHIAQLKTGNAISTSQRYHSAISRYWLASTETENLASYTAFDFELLYTELLDEIETSTERGYAVGRLQSLHEYGVQQRNLPRLSAGFFSSIKSNSRPHIRAGVVSEVLFEQLLCGIDNISNTNQETIETIKAMVIIAFRCGLRLGEIVKLQTADVLADLRTSRLYIAPNKYGSNKTENSNRIVPLSILLLDAEKQLVETHIRKRRLSQIPLLFSTPDNPNQPMNGQLIANLVIYYLRQMSGDNSYVFHHLRHSCLSRLQLILQGETSASLPLFVPYESAQVEAIKQTLWAKHDKIEYALAKFAGHYSPATTYSSYFHFTEYAIGKKLSAITLPTQGKLSNKSAMLDKLLVRCPKTAYLNAPISPRVSSINECAINKYGSEATRPIKINRIPLPIIHSLLEQHHKGETVEALCLLHGLAPETLEHYYHNALQLREQKRTRYNNSALFATHRSSEMLPSLPKTHAERHYVEKLLPILRDKYPRHKANFAFVISHTLNNVSANNSGVMFYDVQDFTRYINTLALLRIKSHLRIIRHRADSAEWQKALKGFRQQTKTDKAIDYQKNRRGVVRLLLIHPNEKNILANQNDTDRKMKRRERYSSNLLVYLFHMMAITMKE